MEKLDEEFLLELFNVSFRKKSILEILVLEIKESYLPDETWRRIFREIKAQFEISKKLPSYGALRLTFRKSEKCLNLISKIREQESEDKNEVLLDGLETFLKRGMFLEIYSSVADSFNQDNSDDAYTKFLKGAERFSNFSIRKKSYDRVFRDFEKRNVQRLIEANTPSDYTKLTYGIDELDLLTGGPETGEYILFMATAKSGKSFLLSHIGMSIARLGYPVAHFQLEGPKRQVLSRYDAAFTGTLMEDIKRGDIDRSKLKSLKRIIEGVGKGEIYVVAPERFSALSMLEIRANVIDLKKNFGDIKAVIIDYLELSDPGEKRYRPSEEKQRQQKISQQMKELAIEQNVLVISATQANNISFELLNDPDFYIRRENLSEDKSKVNPVDGLISINRTADEMKSKTARLFIDAYRERAGDQVIQVATSFNRGRFYNRKRTLNEFFINED